MNRLRQRLFVRSLEDRTAPATFTVMNLADSGADSLRDCVSKANAAAGADTIAFQAGLTGTITLTSGEIAISQAVTFTGPGSSVLSISGNNAQRLFNISSAPAATAISFSGLTLTGGFTSGLFAAGSAITGNSQSLNLTNCALTNHKSSGFSGTGVGGAIVLTGGTLTADNCLFTGNSATNRGGALAVQSIPSKLTLTQCTVSNNTAGTGGGIYANDNVTITSCTISSNTAVGDTESGTGGGILIRGSANAITIRNSTFSGNVAAFDGGGIGLFTTTNTLTVQNSTITGNSIVSSLAGSGGGGIARFAYSTSTIALESTIVSGNVSVNGPDILSTGTVNVKTSAVGSGSGFTLTPLGTNLPFQAHANLKLGPLANNGGATLTHLPALDSPLVNVGSNPAALTTDQRGAGFPRTLASAPDIGSVEAPLLVVSNINNSGTGSLRQAILDANTIPGPDTVTFDPTVFATPQVIKLTSSEMAINDAVTIIGPAGKVTIDGNAAGRIFNSATAPVTLQNLILTNGKAVSGGAVSALSLTLKACAVTNSQAELGGAVSIVGTGGSLLIEDSTLSGNQATFEDGGAIRSSSKASVTIRRSTLSGNTAKDCGGAVYFADGGSLTIEDSTLSGNTANAIGDFRGGGAVYFRGVATNFLISNSTLSGNSAPTGKGGAVFLNNFDGTAAIQNSTITNNLAGTNGGGIARVFGSGTVLLASTIVAGNTNANTPDLSFGTLTNVAGNNNLIGVADVGNVTLTGTGNFTGMKAAPLNAKLRTLMNDGGPTQTHALLPGSPAIDHGDNPASLTNDQRGTGFLRLTGTQVDIGAFEAQPDFLVRNINDSGFGSLRHAIFNANVFAGTDTVTFDVSVFFVNAPQTITLTTGEIAITEAITISGPGADRLTVSGNSSSRIFNTQSAPPAAAITISGLTLANGRVTFTIGGGAILSGDESITISACKLTGNSAIAAGSGGAVFVQFGGSLTATDTVWSSNSCQFSGGAISVAGAGAKAVLRRCTVSGNTSGGSGGGVYAVNDLLIEDSTVSGNKSSSGRGGGIYAASFGAAGTLIVRNSTISGNSNSAGGGGIALTAFNGTLTVQNSTFTANFCRFNGGAINLNSGSGAINIESSILFGDVGTNGPEIFTAGTATVNSSLVASKLGVATFIGDAFTVFNIGVDPLLGPLQDNGGSILGPLQENVGPTQTHTPGVGSKALGNGSNPAGLTNDQRGTGFARQHGAAVDIGAVEMRQIIVTNGNDSGLGSLREAITAANASPDSDTVGFDPAVFATVHTISLLSALPDLTESVAIVGSGMNLLTIQRNSAAAFRLFFVDGNDTAVTLSDMTLTNGAAAFDGGAILSFGKSLTLDRVKIIGNTASRNGGGVAAYYATLLVRDSTIVNNSASGGTSFGGGIAVADSLATIERSTISSNTAVGGGGGMLIYGGSGGTVTIRNSTISGNSASTGGGIDINSFIGTVSIQNSTVTANSASHPSGVGGIRFVLTNSATTIQGTIVSNNSAPSFQDMNSPGSNGTLSVGTSAIGTISGTYTDLGGNLPLGTNLKLGALANNGGPTLTHALLSGSPCINAGSNVASLTTDQRGSGFARSGGVTDIGAFEVQPAAKVTSVQINDGSLQRSRVTALLVTFDQTPNLPTTPTAAFQLKRLPDNAIVTLNAIPNGNTVLFTFAAGPIESGSLADGRYTLTAFASQILNLDGDGNGVIGGNYVLASAAMPNPPTNIFRFFGDADGDGTVANNDFNLFRSSFGGTNDLFDFDNDGSVSGSDFNQFRNRFGGSI